MNTEILDLREVLQSCLPFKGLSGYSMLSERGKRFPEIYELDRIEIYHNLFSYNINNTFLLKDEKKGELLLSIEHIDKFKVGIFKFDNLFYQVKTRIFDNNHFFLELELI